MFCCAFSYGRFFLWAFCLSTGACMRASPFKLRTVACSSAALDELVAAATVVLNEESAFKQAFHSSRLPPKVRLGKSWASPGIPVCTFRVGAWSLGASHLRRFQIAKHTLLSFHMRTHTCEICNPGSTKCHKWLLTACLAFRLRTRNFMSRTL